MDVSSRRAEPGFLPVTGLDRDRSHCGDGGGGQLEPGSRLQSRRSHHLDLDDRAPGVD
jgi:hypothetical protein